MAAGKRGSAATTVADELNEVIEHCGRCDRETRHEVSIRIITDAPDKPTGKYAREPCRVTRCRDCDEVSTEKITR